MRMHTLASLALALAAGAAALPARADLIAYTGTPSSSPVGGYALDANDWVAAQITIAAPTTLDAIMGYISGDTAGETFTVSLYDANGVSGLPGNVLNSATATYNAAGWNGLNHAGWSVGSGSYWLAFEVGATDTLASNFELSVMNAGAPSPLAHTAYNAGSGYQASPMSMGVQVSAVPLPAPLLLLPAGLGLSGLRIRRRSA